MSFKKQQPIGQKKKHRRDTTMQKRLKVKQQQFEKNITKRGMVESHSDKNGLGVGPYVIAFFIFVVVGSAILQIIRTV